MTQPRSRTRRRGLVLVTLLLAAFVVEGAQLTLLGLKGTTTVRSDPVETVTRNVARPDIIDRNGRLLATDIALPSLFADPRRVLDKDEVAEKLSLALSGIDDNVTADPVKTAATAFPFLAAPTP